MIYQIFYRSAQAVFSVHIHKNDLQIILKWYYQYIDRSSLTSSSSDELGPLNPDLPLDQYILFLRMLDSLKQLLVDVRQANSPLLLANFQHLQLFLVQRLDQWLDIDYGNRRFDIHLYLMRFSKWNIKFQLSDWSSKAQIWLVNLKTSLMVHKNQSIHCFDIHDGL